MKKPIQNYWALRLEQTRKALEKNNFDVFVAKDGSEAKDIVLNTIIPSIKPRTLSWGGSVTLVATGLYEALKDDARYEVLDTFDKKMPKEDMAELRRQALLVDVFMTGTNALTQAGQLVNLDMYGNRVAAITFGPKHVIILVGRNKIVADLDEAVKRVKGYAAPVNAMRLDKKTPCVHTAVCEECKSPERICNTWTITEKGFPKGRTKVVLINQDLGF
ncbi:MAG: lactate utilization protein [Deltaproteobacteria bacterium]|nr:lactate utilization protein [Deltaproteobacteria bacterium]